MHIHVTTPRYNNNVFTKKKTPEMYILDKQNLQLITNFQNHYLFLINKIYQRLYINFKQMAR